MREWHLTLLSYALWWLGFVTVFTGAVLILLVGSLFPWPLTWLFMWAALAFLVWGMFKLY
jgi:hypothetical protein